MRKELWQGANEESDRGFVIVSHSYLDETLRDVCKAVFHRNQISRKLTTKLLNSRGPDGPAPLGGFWTKAVLLHAFGTLEEHLFDSLFELNSLRNNHGAHTSRPYRLRLSDAQKIVAKLDPNLARYVTEMSDAQYQNVLEFRSAGAIAFSKHTDARCLLENYVFVIEGMLRNKENDLNSKD